jgi:hypothetical protein
MLTRRRSLAWFVVLMLLAPACGRVSRGTEVPPHDSTEPPASAIPPTGATEPPATFAPTPEASEQSPTTCLSSLSLYPGAQEAPQTNQELDVLVRQMQALSSSSGGLVAAYVTPDPPGQVVRFYQGHPPAGDWIPSLDLTTPEEGGIVVWERNGYSAQVFIATVERDTVILLGCGGQLGTSDAEASPTPSAAEDAPVLAISSDGLGLVVFEVEPSTGLAVGDTVIVRFTLRNTAERTVTFDDDGVFVGCRRNSTSDENNCDFGQQLAGESLAPGGELTLQTERVLDAAGFWRLWPTYHVNGAYGPFRWNEQVVPVTNATPEPQWQTYANPEAGFTFTYPLDWVIEEEYFYETAAGARAEQLTVVLKQVGNEEPNDRVTINPRQFQCEFGRCVAIGDALIATYTSDPDVLAAFETITSTFAVP